MAIYKDRGNKDQESKPHITPESVMEEKNPSPERKNLSPDHPSENFTRMNSCSTWITINPPSLYLPMYLSPPSFS